MILCVNTSALTVSNKMQKDVHLGDLLKKHTKYFDTVEDALKEKYVPLDVSTTIRSMYSNKVVEIRKGDKTNYYVNLTHIDKFIHEGYDLLMYLSSIGVMHTVNYNFKFDEVMMKHSQFYPIGLYNPDPSVMNPILLTHIILSDEGAELFRAFLREDCSLVPINSMTREGNVTALLDEIIEVKEKKNEQHDNDN